jgi:hypothetical protein
MLAGFFDEFQSEVSGEVGPVAVADVHRTVRRRRRARITAVAAVSALAAITPLTAYAAIGTNPTGPPVAGSNSTAAPSTAATSPSSNPSTNGQQRCAGGGAVPTDAGPSPYYGPGETGPAPQTGPLFYLQATAGPGTSTLQLVSWTPGQSTTTALHRQLPADAGMNANVSPDGKWVSWVTLADGALHVAALDGKTTDRVLRRSVDGRLLEPVWSRDSARLLIRDASTGRVGTIDITSASFTPLPTNLDGARHAVWAADGSAIAFITPNGDVATAKPDGSGQRRIPGTGRFQTEGRHIASLQSLSGSGGGDATLSLFVVGPGTSPDGCRSLVSNTMLRTSNGQHMADPAQRGGDYTPYQAAFRGAAFSHVSRALSAPRTVELIGTNGEFWGGVNEPQALASYLLLGN